MTDGLIIVRIVFHITVNRRATLSIVRQIVRLAPVNHLRVEIDNLYVIRIHLNDVQIGLTTDRTILHLLFDASSCFDMKVFLDLFGLQIDFLASQSTVAFTYIIETLSHLLLRLCLKHSARFEELHGAFVTLVLIFLNQLCSLLYGLALNT